MPSFEQQFAHSASDEEIAPYLQDIMQLPVLSRKAERYIVQELADAPTPQEADAARRRLIEGNLHLVLRLARRYQRFGLPLADLVQEGNIALVEAAQRFDPKQRTDFRLGAKVRISRTLARVVWEHLSRTYLPGPELERLDELTARLAKTIGCREMDEHPCATDLLEERCLSLESLDREVWLLPLLTAWLHQQERRACIEACLRTLTAGEQAVLTALYLLDSEKTLWEVASLLNITYGYARKVEERGLRKLRHPSRAALLRRVL